MILFLTRSKMSWSQFWSHNIIFVFLYGLEKEDAIDIISSIVFPQSVLDQMYNPLSCLKLCSWLSSSFLQILEVNGQNFENVQLSKANEILKNNTHLSITVKTNLLGKAYYKLWYLVNIHQITGDPMTIRERVIVMSTAITCFCWLVQMLKLITEQKACG